MRLDKLISNITDVAEVKGLKDIEITGLDYDSRRMTPGKLFVAIPGMNFDGHKFIPDALSKGAVAILGEQVMDLGDTPYIRVKDSRKALAQVSDSFYGHSAKELKIIGITGTNGKTTTTYLVKAILEKAGFDTGVIGTVGTWIGEEMLPAERTTPEALELNKTFRDMVDKDIDYAVMEVSSHSLKLHRVEGIPFEVGVFTNLTQDHLDFHQNFEDYFESKALLFKAAKKSVINADDAAGETLLKRLTIPAVSYGIDKPALVKAEEVRVTGEGVYFEAVIDGNAHPVFYGVPGKFSVYNALAAIATGIALGLPPETILEALAEVKGVPGRFETVKKGQDFTVIVDYAHTPDGLENVIKASRSFCTEKIITVFGCGGDRDRKKRPIMGQIATTLSDYCIITSDNPRSEDPEAIIDDIERGCASNNYERNADRRSAIKRALTLAQKGDVVLIAGKGHETYQILGNKTIHFDDREVAGDLLVSEGI